MSKAKIIENAYSDYELYQNDFIDFSSSTLKYIRGVDIFDMYWSTLIFKNWKEGINSAGCVDLNEIFDELHQDVNASYYLSLMGLYRTANMHLRSLIELSLQLLYFYEHPVELKKWKFGKFIIKFDKLSEYLKEYPGFSDEQTLTQAGRLIDQISKEWKNYSKHIHAESLIYFQTQKKSGCNKSFNIEDFSVWKSSFVKIVLKINNLFMLFFSEQYRLFPSHNKDLLSMGLVSN